MSMYQLQRLKKKATAKHPNIPVWEDCATAPGRHGAAGLATARASMERLRGAFPEQTYRIVRLEPEE